MTVTLDLTPEQEAAIKQQAEEQGVSVEEWLRGLVDARVPRASIAHLQQSDPEEWIRRFEASLRSRPGAGYSLPDEAYSRENLYEDRY